MFEEEERDAKLEEIKNDEIYQQAKEDNKIEIAHKLLAKGLSVQEVAEIVELDVDYLSAQADAPRWRWRSLCLRRSLALALRRGYANDYNEPYTSIEIQRSPDRNQCKLHTSYSCSS